MTGEDLKNKFNTAYDEDYSGYFSDTQLQRICDTSLNNLYERKLEEYAADDKITDEIMPFTSTVSVTPTAGNIVDISPTSSVVPNYKKLINARATYQVNTNIYRKQARELKMLEKYNFYAGDVRYPRYEKNDNQLIIHPTTVSCTNVLLDYITLPTPIDITDNVNDLPYTNKFLEALVVEMKIEASRVNREVEALQINNQEQIQNP